MLSDMRQEVTSDAYLCHSHRPRRTSACSPSDGWQPTRRLHCRTKRSEHTQDKLTACPKRNISWASQARSIPMLRSFQIGNVARAFQPYQFNDLFSVSISDDISYIKCRHAKGSAKLDRYTNNDKRTLSNVIKRNSHKRKSHNITCTQTALFSRYRPESARLLYTLSDMQSRNHNFA